MGIPSWLVMVISHKGLIFVPVPSYDTYLNSSFLCHVKLIDNFSSFFFQVRKKAYITGNSAPHANVEVIDRLIAARHELSQVLLS